MNLHLQMKKGFPIAGFVLLLLVFIHGGAVRKKDDPILRTQTNPILYKEKMEEMKDGEKEAPLPSFKLYRKEEFLADPPMAAEPKRESRGIYQEEVSLHASESLPGEGDVHDDEWEELQDVEETEGSVKEEPKMDEIASRVSEKPGREGKASLKSRKSRARTHG